MVQCSIVATDYLVLRSILTHLVVADAESHHVHTHIRGRLVRILAVDTLKQSVQHRENLDVTIVVDGNLAVSLIVERVDHVHIVQVGSCSLVGNVYRMLQR